MSGSVGDNVFRASGVIAAAAAGRTGTVDWDTTIYVTGDSPITSENGKGYFLNTTAGTITINLPTSPSAGAIVSLKDYARTWGTNNVTVGRGGSNMDGSASDATLATDGLSVTFIYMDATKGWSLINDDTTTSMGASFIVASGGNQPTAAGCTVCTDYKQHTFTGPGDFVVSSVGNAAGSNAVDYLVIAGGGGGGGNGGAAGGAGGYREGTTTYTPVPSAAIESQIPVTASTYPITVGGGGTAGSHPVGTGGSGANSVFSTITSTGGGGGGSNAGAPNYSGLDGGSGGGKAQTGTAGSGNTPCTTPSQGNPGGGGGGASMCTGSGGGGIGGAGGDSSTLPGNPTCQIGGSSGAGMDSEITGSSIARGGGGSGGMCNGSPGNPVPVGPGGGGSGSSSAAPNQDGTANTGGGAGGGGSYTPGTGGVGGSGVVIIRYKFQ